MNLCAAPHKIPILIKIHLWCQIMDNMISTEGLHRVIQAQNQWCRDEKSLYLHLIVLGPFCIADVVSWRKEKPWWQQQPLLQTACSLCGSASRNVPSSNPVLSHCNQPIPKCSLIEGLTYTKRIIMQQSPVDLKHVTRELFLYSYWLCLPVVWCVSGFQRISF